MFIQNILSSVKVNTKIKSISSQFEMTVNDFNTKISKNLL